MKTALSTQCYYCIPSCPQFTNTKSFVSGCWWESRTVTALTSPLLQCCEMGLDSALHQRQQPNAMDRWWMTHSFHPHDFPSSGAIIKELSLGSKLSPSTHFVHYSSLTHGKAEHEVWMLQKIGKMCPWLPARGRNYDSIFLKIHTLSQL